MDQLAEKDKLTVEETGFFTRNSNFIEKIGALKDLLKDAFSLTPQNPYPSKVYSRGDNYFVVKLKEREEVEEGTFVADKNKIRARLLPQKKEERARLWLEDLKAGSQTKIFLTL